VSGTGVEYLGVISSRLVPSPFPGTPPGEPPRTLPCQQGSGGRASAHQQLHQGPWRDLPRLHDCRDDISGLSGRQSQAILAPWQGPTAANSMCPKAWPIFSRRHDTVICDVVRVQGPTWMSSGSVQSGRRGSLAETWLGDFWVSMGLATEARDKETPARLVFLRLRERRMLLKAFPVLLASSRRNPSR
jgi:hypothetical protein